jgi:hypothetical protein
MAVAVTAKGSRDGPYCSQWGQIGSFHVTFPGEEAVYLDEGWSGLPPKDHCSVYAVDPAPGIRLDESNSAELIRSDPSPRLLASGSIPGGGAYFWIFVALLLPPALWGLAVSLDSARTTR